LGSEAAKVGCYKVILLFQLIQKMHTSIIKDELVFLKLRRRNIGLEINEVTNT
jgi:hypothetical protein